MRLYYHLVSTLQVVQEFILGEYDAEATASFHNNQSDVSRLKDPRSGDASQRHDITILTSMSCLISLLVH